MIESDRRDRPGQTVGRSFLFIYAALNAPSRDRRSRLTSGRYLGSQPRTHVQYQTYTNPPNLSTKTP